LPGIGHDGHVAAAPKLPVYLEVGAKRVFAGALEWPGWSRSGRDEAAALQALVAYGPRYRDAIAAATGDAGGAAIGHPKPGPAREFRLPRSPADLEVVERLKGDPTTDFGAPGVAPAADDRPLDDAELLRQAGLLSAAWDALDRAVRQAGSRPLAKGPRGGGRDLAEIVRHVAEADLGYLTRLGARPSSGGGIDIEHGAALRESILSALRTAPRVGPAPAGPRGGRRWTARYFVRRSAWHALDHAWEIEDRSR
jgi:hypothetical protein